MLHDPKDPRHCGLATERDALDGKLYVVDCIDWFIKQGEPVSSDVPIVKSFTRKCLPESALTPNPSRTFPTEVIYSETDRDVLPMVRNSSCQPICKFESDFPTLPLSLFKLKNRHWWNGGAKYYQINYLIKVDFGAADVSFELWHNGVRLSKDSSIKVEWQTTEPRTPGANLIVADFPMSLLPTAAVPT